MVQDAACSVFILILFFAPPLAFVHVLRAARAHYEYRHAVHTRWHALHNGSLAVFSAGMCCYLWSHWAAVGGPYDVCAPRPPLPAWFHAAWFTSKLWEWLDTVILVSRKRHVSRLHAVHHAITPSLVVLQWRADGSHTPLYEVGVLLNAAVHTAMYAYFAAPHLAPPLVRRLVTSAQTLQHAIMVALITASVLLPHDDHHAARPCERDLTSNAAPLVAYVFFFWEFSGILRRGTSMHHATRDVPHTDTTR
jgi:hypothetical protein